MFSSEISGFELGYSYLLLLILIDFIGVLELMIRSFNTYTASKDKGVPDRIAFYISVIIGKFLDNFYFVTIKF